MRNNASHKTNSEWKISGAFEHCFEAVLVVIFICDINESLQSGGVGKWLQRGWERTGPLDFAGSLRSSHRDLLYMIS
jgi:hypothetical protein